MIEKNSGRGHLVAGGFPPGSSAGHDHDYARLRLLGLLAERDVPAPVANDFANIEKWLPVTQLLITYVAGPYSIGWACMGPAAAAPSGSKACTSASPSRPSTTLLGSCFLTHPPICKLPVEVSTNDSPLTRGLPASFDVEDERYFIELQDPGSTRILLTAD